MKVRRMTFGCVLIVAMFAGAAAATAGTVTGAEPVESTPAASTPIVEVEAPSATPANVVTEESTLEVTDPAAGTQSDRGWQSDIGNQNQINCSCECTCLATGGFEVQFFSLPFWTNRSCRSFNGDFCALSGPDTCNSVRRYGNCTQI